MRKYCATFGALVHRRYLHFSSPEPKAPGEFIGKSGSVIRRLSSVVRRPSTLLNDFSSETTGQIVTIFHLQPPGVGGTKRC